MNHRNNSEEFHWGTWEIGGPRHYYRESLIIRHFNRVVRGERILDVGCGTGSLLVKLAMAGYEVYGIDMSDECVETTTRRFTMLGLKNRWEIKKGSALHVDYPDGFFDTLIAAEVLEHLDDDSIAVKEFYRLIRPGGICIVTVPSGRHLWDRSDEMAGHRRRYNRDDLVGLFSTRGFSIEKVVSWGFPLLRLYHRLVFLKWASHVANKRRGRITSNDLMTRIGLSRWITFIVGNIFRIDNIFSPFSWGIGILLIARKPFRDGRSYSNSLS